MDPVTTYDITATLNSEGRPIGGSLTNVTEISTSFALTGNPGAVGPPGPPGPPGTFYFNVKDYGAAGDGVHNDTGAIQTAIAQAADDGQGTVYFPAGTYKITSEIALSTGITLLGVSSEASTIVQATTSANGFVGDDVASVTIQNLLIQGPSSGTGIGINLSWTLAGNMPYLSLRNLWIRDWGGDGIAVETPIVSHFDRVISSNNGGTGFNLYHAGTSTTFTSCFARGNDQAGYHFFESVYITLDGCAADSNGIGYLIDSAQSISINGTGCEGTAATSGTYDGTAFKITNSSGVGLHNCWVYHNNATAIWVTGSSSKVEIFGCVDNTPLGSATAFVKVDSGSHATVSDILNVTANSFATGTTTILSDGAGNMTMPSSVTTPSLYADYLGGNTTSHVILDINATVTGTALIDGLLTASGGLNIPTGASNGYILTSDGSGNAMWQANDFSLPQATSTVLGGIKLAGDIAGGTATAPQVTATHLASALPVNQGGTGSATQNFVDLSATQTIAGVKTFSNAPVVPSSAFPESAIANLISDLTAKASLASPALTGTPTAPTATSGTSTTQLATTAYVEGEIIANATPDATTSSKGKIELAGDLMGTSSTPTVKVRAYTRIVASTGMAGDYIYGSSNAETQINQAISDVDTAGGGTVFIRGNAHITSLPISYNYVPTNPIHIKGEPGAKLSADSTLAYGIFDNYSASTPSNPTKNLYISDLEFDGTGFSRVSGTYHKGINSRNWQNCHLWNLYVHDCTATGIGPDNLYQSTIDRCVVTNNGTSGLNAAATLTSDNTNVSAGNTVSIGHKNATSILTSNGSLPANNNTVTIGSQTYTWKTILSGAAYEVLIGPTTTACILNIKSAINASSGVGIIYGTGTVANTSATAATTSTPATTLKIIAILIGSVGNSVASTVTGATLSFTGSTLSGGTDTVYTFVLSLSGTPYEVLIGVDADTNLTNLSSAINATAGAGTTYGTGTVANPEVTASGVSAHTIIATATSNGSAYNDVVVSTTATHLSWSSSTLTNGSPQPLGNNGIGIASGGLLQEGFIVSNCIAYNNANNDYLVEADTTNTGSEAVYLFVNNISLHAGQNAFRNSGTPNVSFINNYAYQPAKVGIYNTTNTSTHVPVNATVKGNNVLYAGQYGIYQAFSGDGFNIEGNTVQFCTYQGIITGASNGTLTNNTIHDNGKSGVEIQTFSGTNSTLSNVIVSGSVVYNNSNTTSGFGGIELEANGGNIDSVTIIGNRCFDNQGTQTQKYGVFIPNSASYAYSNILVMANNLNGNLTGPISVPTTAGTQITGIVTAKNNIGVNPEWLYSLGNITGATTFSANNGQLQSATLTGNVTATVTNGTIEGDRLVLELTQDSTGGRTISWPVNVKLAQGGLTLSTGANVVDTVSLYWDGTFWREQGRAMSTVSVGTLNNLVITTPNSNNTVSLAVTQNDATNNPNAINITNAGTGHGEFLNQSGVLASNKYGLFVDSSAVQVNAPLIRFRQNSVSSTQATVQLDNTGSGASLNIATGNLSMAAGTSINTATTATLALYNTSDQTTNYERLLVGWNTNIASILTGNGGTGSVRDLEVGNVNRYLRVAATSSSSGGYQFSGGSTSVAGAVGVSMAYTSTASSGLFTGVSITPTINQSSTGGYVGLLVNPTETATGSGVKLLADFQVGAVSKLNIDHSGSVTLTDAANIVLGTTTGTQIGTGTTQKLAFYGSTPIVQSVATTDLGTVLSNLGLRASGTAYPLTTSGAVTLTGTTQIQAPQITGTSGTLNITASSDGADYNIFSSNGAQTLAIYGSAANSLGVKLLDGNLNIGAPTNTSGDALTTDATQTLTNKRVTQRVVSTASSSTPTPNGDITDIYEVTALAAGATFGAPTGTPQDGDKLIIRIKDNGTSQTLAWNAIYRFSSDLAAPTSTIISKTLYIGFIYNSAATKWDCVAQLGNFT